MQVEQEVKLLLLEIDDNFLRNMNKPHSDMRFFIIYTGELAGENNTYADTLHKNQPLCSSFDSFC